ncbi:MAG: MarR family winged helix-turn-helix transcriptional regulator [Pseudomonadota bacterium]
MTQSLKSKALRLSDYLPYRLSVLSNTISRKIAETYEAEFGISMRQWRVMAILGECPGLNATDISERAAMDKVAVSRAVSSLIEMNVLRREATQSDGRRSCLYLTERGEAVYARIVPMAARYEDELTAAMDGEDVKKLLDLLDACASVVAPDRQLW